MTEFNPYSAPQANLTSSGQALDSTRVWRNGKTLVMYRDAELADVCVHCGNPAEGLRIRRRLVWTNPWWYLLIIPLFIGIRLLAFVAAAIVSKRAKVEFGICAKHRSSRRLHFWAALILMGVAIVCLIAAIKLDLSPCYWGAAFAMIGSIAFAYQLKGCRTKRIDKEKIWINGLNEKYLSCYSEGE